jgi:hypothetical protein
MTQTVTHYGDVLRKREAEYPALQTQLEMIWKALGELHDGTQFSNEVLLMMKQIKAVQTKYPHRTEEP